MRGIVKQDRLEFAIRIKKLRQKLGLTQQDFSNLVGVTVRTVTNWEKGKSQPSRLAKKQIEALWKSII